MRKGYIKLYRKTLESRVFQNEGLLKVWVWCLLKANHEGQWVEIKVGRAMTETWIPAGCFIFGRYSAAKELKMSPSTIWKRIKKLENMQNLNIKSNRHYSIIIIVNWNSYQSTEKKGDSKGDHRVTTEEPPSDTNKNDKNDKEETPSLFSLRSRYPDQGLIDRVFKAIASIRKSNRVSESVLIAQLQKWEKYPVEEVQAGIRIYLQKDYASQGKGEAYLLGIIRNHDEESEPRRRYAT